MSDRASECFLAPRYTRFIAFTSKKAMDVRVYLRYTRQETRIKEFKKYELHIDVKQGIILALNLYLDDCNLNKSSELQRGLFALYLF